VQDPGLPWWSWNSLDAAGDTGVAAVSCFAGGDAARTALRVGEGPAAWVDAVAAQRPDLDLLPDGALLTDWASDPWTRGGYSYVLACHPADSSHDRDAVAALQRPVGRLVLAGEYTAGPASGTMEGALLSGVRAARTIAG
jgi:monoamine oxidase